MPTMRIVTLCAALLACAHTQEQPVAAAPKPEPVAQPAPPPAAVAPAPVEVKPIEPAIVSEVPAGSVYFAFDKSYLDEQARATLQKLAASASVSGAKVRIEGNCDERGSNEYNIGLGQRRADAAKTYLANLGVAPDAITAISYGEERPKMPGHDEASWRENRRADVFVSVPPRVSQR